MAVVIVSGDKDMMQLVSDDILMVDTMKEKTYDIAAVKERFGVGPEQVVEILGLMGDVSDNIPGVPGIGPKGAQRLIEQFGSIEAILAHPEQIHNVKTREAILQNADQARLSRELAQIRTDAEFEFDLEDCRRREPDRELLLSLFKEFEFSSLLQELKIRGEETAGDYRICRTPEELEALAARLREGRAFSLEPVLSSPEAMRAALIGLAVSPAPGEGFYIPIAHEDGTPQLSAGAVLDGPVALSRRSGGSEARPGSQDRPHRPFRARRSPPGPRLRHDGRLLSAQSRQNTVLNSPTRSWTTSAAGCLPQRRSSGSGAKAVPFASISVGEGGGLRRPARRRRDVAGRGSDREDRRGGDEGPSRRRGDAAGRGSRRDGTKRGPSRSRRFSGPMSLEIEQLLALSEEKIHRLAGEKFNINSPKQLQAILFEKLGLPRGRKTKEGYSTDVDVLTSLAQNHELPAEILAYRGMAKLKSTYIDALPELVHPRTGRVHTSYNQTVTATGRLSSSNPNLQNIPIRTLEGKRIRQAFIAPPGWEIVSADYSQIELRVLAHLSGDEALLDAFAAGEDIHSRTASDVFGVFPEMVNPDMRRQAKVINFGVLYGMSAFGLAKELGITQKLAQAYIDSYFQRYQGVRAYLDGVLAQARRDGYVTTLLKTAAVPAGDHEPPGRRPAVRRADGDQRPHPGDGGGPDQGRDGPDLPASGGRETLGRHDHAGPRRTGLRDARFREGEADRPCPGGDGGGAEAPRAPPGGDIRRPELGRGAHVRGVWGTLRQGVPGVPARRDLRNALPMAEISI